MQPTVRCDDCQMHRRSVSRCLPRLTRPGGAWSARGTWLEAKQYDLAVIGAGSAGVWPRRSRPGWARASPWSTRRTSAATAPTSGVCRPRHFRARHRLVCTGARPARPSIPGLEQTPDWTYETVWRQARLPRQLLVIGSGPVGIELAQAFARPGLRGDGLHARRSTSDRRGSRGIGRPAPSPGARGRAVGTRRSRSWLGRGATSAEPPGAGAAPRTAEPSALEATPGALRISGS